MRKISRSVVVRCWPRAFIAGALAVALIGTGGLCAQSLRPFSLDTGRLAGTHDILLSPWGPYSKHYAGLSHIPDVQGALRFDLSVVAALNGSRLVIPNVDFASDYYPWEVSLDLTQYTYRYELEWKDQVYVDVRYHVIDSGATWVAIHSVNHTDLPQSIDADLMASVDYPENYAEQRIIPAAGRRWTNAVAYQSLQFAHPRPTDHLPDNGWLRGEIRDARYLDGRAVGGNFGKDSGDQITCQLPVAFTARQSRGNLAIGYRFASKAGNPRTTLRLSGLADTVLTLCGGPEQKKGSGRYADSDSLIWAVIPYTLPASGTAKGPDAAGKAFLKLVSEGGSALVLNGFLLLPPGRRPADYLTAEHPNRVPEKTADPAGRSLVLKYPDIDTYYGLAWGDQGSRIREIKNDELDIFFRKQINDHVSTVFRGNEGGDYTDIRLKTLSLAPREERTVYALVCTGSQSKVQKRLADFDSLRAAATAGAAGKRPASVAGRLLPAGQKYAFAWQLLKATLMTNIVYPIYTQNSFIRHFTPGKWWNSIYTWDLGFIALGLNAINPQLGAECLNAYTTAVGSQSAFVHHGSPVPTQIYAFYDLWNKTQSPRLLAYFYPRLKQYYTFLAGRSQGSTTGSFKSGLLATWDYFYNSGGWDDYPAQVALHRQHGEHTTAPVITTAQCIRIAKMLRLAALQLHLQKDVSLYDQDIQVFGNALQRYAWDSASGYFSYVVHDKDGYPAGHFTYKDSVAVADYNMGLDGAYPLLSGICTPEQEKGLLEKLFSGQHMWTPAGISVVDQAAPYYRTDGYWNGTVWMPHQWFMWKTMLDLGRADLAYTIGQKAMDIYNNEIKASYNSFEYFSPKSGRGGGWHQFSGLSSPVLNWIAAYYQKGTVTTGFEIWITRQLFNKDCTSYSADIVLDDATKAHRRAVLVCMDPHHSYQASFGGESLRVVSPYKGLLEITLPATNKKGRLIIKASD